MTKRRRIISMSLLITAAVGLSTQLTADEPEREGPVKIALHAAAQPTPALKYRLLPGRLDQRPGNAAVHYGKVTAEETIFFGRSEIRDKIEEIQAQPLEQLRGGDVLMPGGGPEDSIQDDIRRGAHCRYCDWQLPIGDVPFYTILLPDAQQTRQFARILAAQSRIQTAKGDYAAAVESFQAGFTLGQHVATGETLVNGLVGIAICGIMSHQMLDFVQQPDAPNLYWALSTLPRPLIDMRDALDVEAEALELSFPELRDIRTAKRLPDEWRELFHRFARNIVNETSSNDSPKPPTPEQLDARCQQILPEARRALVAGGLPASDVAAMSTYQVALLYTVVTYHGIVDEAIKYFFLPYPQASAGIEAVVERAAREQHEIIPIAERLLSAITISRSAIERNDRTIAVLRVLEALRIYGAGHQGKLPEQLEDITEVPIPNDPVTGLPFVYLRDGKKAILQGPTFRDVPLNYEITMVPLK